MLFRTGEICYDAAKGARRLKKEQKGRVLLYAALALAALSSLLFLLRGGDVRPAGPVAVIQVNGEELMRIELEKAGDGAFSIADTAGKQITFEIRDHAIRFLSSDCPDKICVHSGFQRRDGDVACCLPNQTVLIVEEP